MKLDKYEIVSELGKGATGTIYLARQASLNRNVVLKVLQKKYALDLDYITDFHKEAEHAAMLNHPNIVTIFDNGSEGDDHFIVMEYIDGKDLKTLIAEKGKLGLDEFFDYATQIAEGLAYAHKQGIIHRDIKPQNIFITQSKRIKIGDFGISHRIDENSTASKEVKAQGTAKYMAPEQIKNKKNIDGRVDIYSLGCVFFEMLTGRPPFEGSTISEIIYKQLDGKLSPDWKKDIPAPLADLVEKCLQKNPNNRFKSSFELLKALQKAKTQVLQFQQSQGKTTALKPSKRKSSPRNSTRNSVKRLLLVIFILLLSIFVCLGIVKRDRGSTKDTKIHNVYM